MESSVEFAQNDITANIAFSELYTMVKKGEREKCHESLLQKNEMFLSVSNLSLGRERVGLSPIRG